MFKAIEYPDDVDIVFLGDSITERADYNSIFKNKIIVNQGIGSDTTQGLLNRLDVIPNGRNIIIQIGINDLALKRTDTIECYQQIITKIKATTTAKIYIMSVLPITEKYSKQVGVTKDQIKDLNYEIKKIAKLFDVVYIDVYCKLINENNYLKDSLSCDGIHLMGDAYVIIAKEIIKAMTCPRFMYHGEF